MYIKENLGKTANLIADIEQQLRHSQTISLSKQAPFSFQDDLEEFLKEPVREHPPVKNYVGDLLKKYGKKRRQGKVDVEYFYSSCNISPGTWYNFQNGKYTKETLLKIIHGLECNLEEAEKILDLADYKLSNTHEDRVVRAAIMSGHNNIDDMYVILDYYAKQYPGQVKNYLKDKN